MSDLDTHDLRILDLLQDDARLKSEAIAEDIGLSPTAVQRRIKKLRLSGAIEKEVAVLSPKVLGNRITLIVLVALERGGSHIIDAFHREMRRIPEVQQCYYVTGDYDFTLIVTARDMADYEKLTRDVFFENATIRRFHTIVTMDTVKHGLTIPL